MSFSSRNFFAPSVYSSRHRYLPPHVEWRGREGGGGVALVHNAANSDLLQKRERFLGGVAASVDTMGHPANACCISKTTGETSGIHNAAGCSRIGLGEEAGTTGGKTCKCTHIAKFSGGTRVIPQQQIKCQHSLQLNGSTPSN